MFRIKVYRQTIIKLIVLITIIIEVNFFYLLPLPPIFWLGNNDNNKIYIIGMTYIAIILIAIFNSRKIVINKYNLFMTVYLSIQVITSIVLVVHSKNLYSQSLFDMLMCADYLMVPIMVIPYMYLIKKEESFKKFLHIIFMIIFIVQIVIFLQGFIYLFTGSIVFKGMSETGIPRIRGNNIRSTWSAFNFIGIAYAFNCLINNKYYLTSKKKARSMMIITFINLLLFCNTRLLIVATLFMLFIMYVFNKSIALRYKIMLLVTGFFILIFGGVLESFIMSFDINGMYAGSTSVRIHEVEYYWNQFLSNPLFGMGLVRPIRSDLKLVYGGIIGGTPTDVGILGLAAEVGIIGITMFGILLIRGIYIIRKLDKYNNNRLLLIGLLMYILATLPTLIITNISRIVALPLCMAIFESVYYNSKIKSVLR